MYRDSTGCLGKLESWDTSLNSNTILSQAVTDDDSNHGKKAEIVLTFGSSSNWRLVRFEGNLGEKVSPLALPRR